MYTKRLYHGILQPLLSRSTHKGQGVGFHDQSNMLIPKQLSKQFGVTASAPVVCAAPSAGRAGVTDALEAAFAQTRTTRGNWVVSGEGNIINPGVLVFTGAGMVVVVEKDGR